LLKERVRVVFRQLPPALAGGEEAIHQLRVAARRLRVALPLVARKPEGRRVRRARRLLSDLVRAAGQGRDLDVIAALFARHANGSAPATRTLRRRLRDARRRARTRLAEDLLDVEVARLRRQLAAIARRGGVDVSAALARVGAQTAADGDAVVASLTALGSRFDADALHRVRIGCRRLRYAAEVREALGAPAGEAPRLLRDLQERLGAIHDAHVLAAWLARQAPSDARAGRRALAAEARRLQARFVALAHAGHAELLRADPLHTLRAALALLSNAFPASDPRDA
jgi:CHAD domain-containing protein